jgi:hypothetical protein
MRHWIISLVLAGCASAPPAPAATPTEPQWPSPTPMAATPTQLPSQLAPGDPTPPPPPLVAPRGEQEHAMRNCPTALAGVSTTLTNTAVGVDLQITTTDPAVRRRIIELARMHGHLGGADGSAPEHTGLHGGPGSIGHCPVIHADTNVTFTPLANGAVIHISAIVAEDVATVQATVADRLARLAVR